MKRKTEPVVPVSPELKPFVEFDSFGKYTRQKNKIAAAVFAVALAGTIVKGDMVQPIAITAAAFAAPYLMLRRQKTLENMQTLKPQSILDRLGNPSNISLLRKRVNRAIEGAASCCMPVNLAIAAALAENSSGINVLGVVYNGGLALLGATADISMTANLRSQLPSSPDLDSL